MSEYNDQVRAVFSLIFVQQFTHSFLPEGSFGQAFAVHVLDYDRRVSPLFLILFHEFGNILRRIACVGIVRTDDQDRVIFISMDPACEE